MTNAAQLYAGSRIVAEAIRNIAPLAAYKAQDQTVSTGVGTLQNDDELLLDVQAGAVYLWLLLATYSGGAAGASDLMAGWSLPSGASMVYGRLGVPAAGGGLAFQKTVDTDVVNYQTAGSGNLAFLNAGTLVTGNVAGTAQFRWAQNSGTATATTVHAGSVLAAWQVR